MSACVCVCVCVGGGGGNAHFILQKWERGMYSAGKESGRERHIFCWKSEQERRVFFAGKNSG